MVSLLHGLLLKVESKSFLFPRTVSIRSLASSTGKLIPPSIDTTKLTIVSRLFSVEDGGFITITQDVPTCLKQKVAMRASASMAGPRPGRVNHNAPKCRLTICDTISGRCSRNASLQMGKFNTVNHTLTSSKAVSMVSMSLTITCDVIGDGAPNYVYVDEIFLGPNN